MTHAEHKITGLPKDPEGKQNLQQLRRGLKTHQEATQPGWFAISVIGAARTRSCREEPAPPLAEGQIFAALQSKEWDLVSFDDTVPAAGDHLVSLPADLLIHARRILGVLSSWLSSISSKGPCISSASAPANNKSAGAPTAGLWLSLHCHSRPRWCPCLSRRGRGLPGMNLFPGKRQGEVFFRPPGLDQKGTSRLRLQVSGLGSQSQA